MLAKQTDCFAIGLLIVVLYKRLTEDSFNALAENGADGIILGYTELGLLGIILTIQIPIFDTTLIHAKAAVEFALK